MDSADNVQVRNFFEITLSQTVSQINVFCILHRNSRWPPKNGVKGFVHNVVSTLYRYPAGPKFCRNRSIMYRFRDKCAFALYALIQDGYQKSGGKAIFFEKSPVDSAETWLVQNFVKITLSRTVKEIEANLCFCIFRNNSKIQNGSHFWGEENFLKIGKSRFSGYPVGRKFQQNRSISHG